MKFGPLSLLCVALLATSSFGQVLSQLNRALTLSVPDRLNQTASTTSNSDASEPKRWEASTEFSYESLNNSFAPWYSAQFTLSRKSETGQIVFGSYRESSRFSLHDREIVAGLRQPLSKNWALQVEAGASPTHHVAPRWTAQAQIERQFKRGWVAQAGFRHSAFNAVHARLGTASLERYWSRYRVAYTLYAGAAQNTGVSVTHRVAGNYFYGAENAIGIGGALGRELTNLGSRGLLRTNVRSLSVNGRHWLNARWACNYAVIWHEQGHLYVRKGLTIGISYRF